ncbi:MAG: hypothetical protein L0215_05140, partial [Gemmataceae bacterium]|nr:hypothetical protein [Gemmataceae bacterium]
SRKWRRPAERSSLCYGGVLLWSCHYSVRRTERTKPEAILRTMALRASTVAVVVFHIDAAAATYFHSSTTSGSFTAHSLPAQIIYCLQECVDKLKGPALLGFDVKASARSSFFHYLRRPDWSNAVKASKFVSKDTDAFTDQGILQLSSEFSGKRFVAAGKVGSRARSTSSEPTCP